MKEGPPTPPSELPQVTTEELRRTLSHVINRAAYGEDPVVVTRRGFKIAAVISFLDFIVLEKLKMEREEYRKAREACNPSGGKSSTWAMDLQTLLG